MLNYYVIVNKNLDVVIIDYEVNDNKYKTEIGLKLDFKNWISKRLEYINDTDICFDKNKAFYAPGIYKLLGEPVYTKISDSLTYDYIVDNVIKVSELPY